MELVKTFVLTYIRKFANDWTINLASMITYSLVTAVFPLLLLILSVAAILLAPFVRANIDTVVAAINSALPEAVRNSIDVNALLDSIIHITGPVAVIALISLAWFGSNLFVNVENAFSIIYRVGGRAFIPQRLVALGMVLILAVLLPLSLGAASLVTVRSSDLRAVLPSQLQQVADHVVGYVSLLASLGVLWLLFLAIYMVVPHTTVPFRHAVRGALAAALLFGGFQLLFPLYFRLFLTGNAKYGAAAASILVVIIWLWFFALFTLVGAQVTAVAMGLKESPDDLACTFAAAYQQLHPRADRTMQSARSRPAPDVAQLPDRDEPRA